MRLAFGKQAKGPTIVPAPIGEDGRVDLAAVPAGAAVQMRIDDPGSAQHGSEHLLAPDGQGAAVHSPDGSSSQTVPAPGAPAPAGTNPDHVATAAAAALAGLDAAYGTDAPLPTEQWITQATKAATAAGFAPDLARLVGGLVADALAAVARERQAIVRDALREQASRLVASRFNDATAAVANRRLAATSAETKAKEYQPATGLHLRDFPLAPADLVAALEPVPDDDPIKRLARPAEVTITRGQLAALRGEPLEAIRERIGTIVRVQAEAQGNIAFSPLLAPGDPKLARDPDEADLPEPATVRGALVLRTPALSAKSFQNPDEAAGARSLHAAHDRLRLRHDELTTAPPLRAPAVAPPEGGKPLATRRLQELCDPGHAHTTLADLAAAGDPLYADPPELAALSPALPGFLGHAVSVGAARTLALAFAGRWDLPAIGAICDLLPPEAVVVGLALLALTEHGPAAAELLATAAADAEQSARIHAAVATEKTKDHLHSGGDLREAAEELTVAAAAAGAALGALHVARCLRWAADGLLGWLFRHDDPGDAPLEIRCGDNARAARACAEALARSVGAPTLPIVAHDGGEHVVRCPARLVAAQIAAQIQYEADTERLAQRKYDASAVGPEPGLREGARPLTRAERNAVVWLRAAQGGVVVARPDRDPAAIAAGLLGAVIGRPGEAEASLVLVTRRGAVARSVETLTALVDLPAGSVVDLASVKNPAELASAQVIVTGYGTAAQRYDWLAACHPDLLILDRPPLLSWQRGGGVAPLLPALFALCPRFRVAIAERALPEAAIRMADLVFWSQGGLARHATGSAGEPRFRSPLPPRELFVGLDVGLGAGTAAEGACLRTRLAPRLAACVLDGDSPQPRAILLDEVAVAPKRSDADLARAVAVAKKRTAAEPGVRGKDVVKQAQQRGLRPAIDAEIATLLYAEGSPLAEAFLAHVDEGSHAVLVPEAAAAVPVAVLAAHGLQAEGELAEVVNVVGLTGASLTAAAARVAAGTARVAVLSAAEIDALPVGRIDVLHVLGHPAAAAAIVDHAAGIGVGSLRVILYPVGDALAPAGWGHARAAVAAAGAGVLQKALGSLYQPKSGFRSPAATIPSDTPLAQTTREGHLHSDRPHDLWTGLLGPRGRFAGWDGVKGILTNPMAPAHPDPTGTGAAFQRELGREVAPAAILSGRAQPLEGRLWTGEPFSLGLHHLFKLDANRRAELREDLDLGRITPEQLSLPRSHGDRGPGVLPLTDAGAHLASVRGLFADPDLVWSRPQQNGSTLHFLLRRELLTPGHGRAGPVDRSQQQNARYHMGVVSTMPGTVAGGPGHIVTRYHYHAPSSQQRDLPDLLAFFSRELSGHPASYIGRRIFTPERLGKSAGNPVPHTHCDHGAVHPEGEPCTCA